MLPLRVTATNIQVSIGIDGGVTSIILLAQPVGLLPPNRITFPVSFVKDQPVAGGDETNFSIKICSPSVVLNFTHKSTVKSFVPKLRLGLSGTITKSSIPSKENACPTNPAPNVAPYCNVPWFPFTMSFVFPSPGHQLTKPAGGVMQTMSTSPSRTAQAYKRAEDLLL